MDALTQRTIEEIQVNESEILPMVEAFLVDRRVANLAPGTVKFYRQKMKMFIDFCAGRGIRSYDQITADELRRYLYSLREQGGHNAGGINACYRALRAFLRWIEAEFEPETWKTPTRKVKAPKVDIEPLQPVSMETVKALLATCKTKGFTDRRDGAIILFLLDTGCRASEALAVNLDDVNLTSGAVTIRKSKARKPRTVFIGRSTRKAVRAYLKGRPDDLQALFVTDEGERLSYDGLRAVVTRRSRIAGIPAPSLHSFRRAFALSMLRSGVDVFTLQKLMGHSSLEVLKRYLAETDADSAAAHAAHSPADHLKRGV